MMLSLGSAQPRGTERGRTRPSTGLRHGPSGRFHIGDAPRPPASDLTHRADSTSGKTAHLRILGPQGGGAEPRWVDLSQEDLQVSASKFLRSTANSSWKCGHESLTSGGLPSCSCTWDKKLVLNYAWRRSSPHRTFSCNRGKRIHRRASHSP